MKALHVVQALLIVTIVLVAFGPLVNGLATGQTQEHVEKSGEWCDQRGGQLAMVHSVLHGGLHCNLPNGTSVHMWRVIDNE